jgi:hypothetical protein
MVEVEIRSPAYDEEAQSIRWLGLALVRADGPEITIYGDESVVVTDPVMSLAAGRTVHIEDDAEDWVRNLPYAYRGGDLIAVLLRDDNAPDIADAPSDQAEPEIPEPPIPVFESDDVASSSTAGV